MHRYDLDREFILMIDKIITNKEFINMKTFLHHRDSVYDHSLDVAYYSYLLAKKVKKIKRNLSIENVVYAALLHDFYLIPWRQNKHYLPWRMHGFVHGRVAQKHAMEVFPKIYNKRIGNSIRRHMFPLTPIPPRYTEGWIITLCDKYASCEIFKKPKELPRYIGIDLANGKLKKLYSHTKKFVNNMY